MRLPSHETGFDLANSLHPARYRDNAVVSGCSLSCAYKELTFAPSIAPVSKNGPEGPLLSA